MSTTTYFTAAEIALPLNVSRRAIQLRLAEITATATVIVRGQPTRAWSLSSLPLSLLDELAAIAVRRGYAGVPQLLTTPPVPYVSPLPWAAIATPHQQNAEKLCAALAPVLRKQHELSGPDLMELASAQYRQHFGHDLGADKLRYIMDRASKRDNGFEQWERPDLFLDDAALKPASGELATVATGHDCLKEVIASVRNKSEPDSEDRRHLFADAFRHLEAHAVLFPSVGERRAFKHSLIAYLLTHVPGLYRPQTGSEITTHEKPLLALRGQFNRLHREWVSLNRPSILPPDLRSQNSGRTGYSHTECEQLIIAHAARLRGDRAQKGNLDLAIKFLSEKKEICAECAERFLPDRLSATIRERLTPNALQVAHFKGPDAVRKLAPTHHTLWDTTPGDRFVIDDMTTNEITWDEVGGEIVSGQAQLLYTEDEFSSYPLPFLLYFGAPNSRTIKKALGLVLTHVGLPRMELLTERGVFANRQLAGERGIQHHAAFRELQAVMNKHFKFAALPDEARSALDARELGWRDPMFGLAISQARSPQAKTVERSFYEFQKSASRLPGFGGFNQRNEKTRAMQDFDRRVKIGKEHPGNQYLHLSDLRKNYELLCAEIAARPINGVRHRGRSPLEVWQEALSKNPLRKLPAEIEAQLHSHRIPDQKVQSRGIAVRLDKYETAYYFNSASGGLVGQRVAIRINYDLPGFIYIEHPATGELLKVDRQMINRTTATPEEIAKVNRARREHINGALGEIGNVKNLFTSYVVRDREHSPADLAKGAQIAADVAEHHQMQATDAREQKRLARKASLLGTQIPSKPRNAARMSEALDLEAEARAEIAAMNNANPEKQ